MARKRKKDLNNIKGNIVIQRPLEEVMHDSIMPYAEYVIMERALPRVEDGLKPVQRRILYTMYELDLSPDKPYRKSARIVGDTLGKYHPHGDTSVYDAMVRMAQPFNMGEMLVDGHGNFGSIDGDSAAAMRYTEAKMTPLAMEMLRDIEKDTVPFGLNFDDTLKEPEVLPARFPNLLVNGASGIAVGLATNIPPHNLGEVIDGVIARMHDPDISLEELLKIIPGPDFPTGGILVGQEGIYDAYNSGRGKVIIRAKVDIEDIGNGKKALVITELPYQVNKANLLEKILKLSEERKGILSGISDIRDESDRKGIRAVIEIKKDADAEKILNYLYKYSDLQVTFGINMVAIADGKPRQLGLQSMIDYYIAHQKDIVTKRTIHDLEKAKSRAHILEGLIKAIEDIDKVIALIRSSKNPKEARGKLMSEFDLTEIQAQAILDMRLQKLTNLESIELEKEYNGLLKTIEKLSAILSSEKQLLAIIKKELGNIKKKYACPRRTQIIRDSSEAEIKIEDLIYVEDMVITLTHNQEIKRVSLKSFNRSSKDVETVDIRAGDYMEYLVDSSTDHRLLFFTDIGNCYSIDCINIPEGKWKDRGVKLSSLINGLDTNEHIISVLSIKEFSEDRYIQFYTSGGMVKRTILSEYEAKRTKIQACGLKKDDRIIGAQLTHGEADILLITKNGMSIRFSGQEVSSMGRTACGVRGIQLKDNDEVVWGNEVKDDGKVSMITDMAFGHKVKAEKFERQGRGGIGFKGISLNKNGRNGTEVISVFYDNQPYEIILQPVDGDSIRVSTEDIKDGDRGGRGHLLSPIANVISFAYRNYY
ncbi:MAG: DNA gyrase subunit A [Xylanivirga thermophila]|jgi:DNA gyrase A subunit|uniref:DNA gyrase subunit A n=1 Tax=Xylanivirga thermophila TaxID=2496273 RepID=UPI0039F55C36